VCVCLYQCLCVGVCVCVYIRVCVCVQALFPDGVHVNADQDPHTVFECVESRVFKRPDIRPNQ
jgi:hypothetical protein